MLCLLGKELVNMALPMLLREMVIFIEDPAVPAQHGITIALMMFAGNMSQCYLTVRPSAWNLTYSLPN
eukprot:SAG31_NODE_2699_length_5225_cov_2.190987_2_plen_68_part_00